MGVLRKKYGSVFIRLNTNQRLLCPFCLMLRGPCGAHDEFLLAATAQNLRKLAKLVTSPGLYMIQRA